jgi:hyperosmotically inducible protein
MNSRTASCLFLFGALLVPAAGHAADAAAPSATTTFVKDSAITAKIKTELAAEKLSSLVRIQVDTDAEGAVTLSGTASSRPSADKAVTIAQSVKGVRSVKDDIKVVADQ